MAYVENFNDDDELKKDESGNVTTSSETTLQSTAPAGGSSAPAGQQKPTGSGFTNLVSYVKANRPQAAAMGEKVTGGIQDQVNQANQQAQQFKSTYESEAAKAATKDEEVISGLAANPAKFAEDAWKKRYETAIAGYQGPTTSKDSQQYRDISSQYQKAGEQVGALDSFEGRQQIVKDTFGKGINNYRRGEQRLDAFLLGTGGGGEKLADFKQQYAAQDPNKQWESLVGAIETNLAAAKKTAEDTKTATLGAYDTALGGYGKKFQGAVDELGKESGAKATQRTALQEALRRGDYSQVPGLDAGVAQWLQGSGTDLGALVQGTSDRALGDVVGQSDIDAYDALLGLTGQERGFDFGKTGGTTQAFTLNQGAIAQARAAKEQYEKDLAEQLALEKLAQEAYQNTLPRIESLPAQELSAAEQEAMTSSQAGAINEFESLMRDLENGLDLQKLTSLRPETKKPEAKPRAKEGYVAPTPKKKKDGVASSTPSAGFRR